MKDACTIIKDEINISNTDVTFCLTGNAIRIPFPEEKLDTLRTLDPDNQTGFLELMPQYFGHNSLPQLGAAAGINGLVELVQECANATADKILGSVDTAKKNGGRLPFNGASRGISKLSTEGDSAVISIHKSNFFTNRTMNGVFVRLIENQQISIDDIKKAVLDEEDNKLAFLFGSFGANVSILSQSSIYMMGTRPNGQSHVAVNEGMNENEQNDTTLHDLCARGIKEELGINVDDCDTLIQAESVRGLFLTATGQFGIHTLYDLNMTADEILKAQAHADDAWENPSITAIPFTQEAMSEAVSADMVPYTKILLSRLMPK